MRINVCCLSPAVYSILSQQPEMTKTVWTNGSSPFYDLINTTNLMETDDTLKRDNLQIIKYRAIYKGREPWLVWLSGLSTGLRTKRLLVRFPARASARAHAWVASQVPSRGHTRGNYTLMFLSPSPSLLSLKSSGGQSQWKPTREGEAPLASDHRTHILC